MSSGGNSETPNCKKSRKIDTCNRPEAKCRPVEQFSLIKPAGEKIYMMICTKQRCRDKNGKYNRVPLAEPQDILK